MGQDNGENLLGGYRVLDLTDERGLLCGKILGDFGADVIKVEKPGGDPARSTGPFYKDSPHPEKSLFWLYTNTSKRGITLNLETADGREIFKRLVKTAHFVIESFHPGYMEGLGLGYGELEKLNPAIIMTSITPFGRTGPYAHYQATDLTTVAMGGMMRLYGEPDRAPLRISQPQAFFLGSLHGALGSMVAHYHRELTGEGQHVDVSCQQAVVLALMIAAEYWDVLKVNYRGFGALITSARPTPPGPLIYRMIWPCKDGHVLFFLAGGGALGVVTSSQRMVEMANREGMILELKGYDWSQYNAATISLQERNELEKPFAKYLLTKTKAELLRAGVAQSIMVAPANTAGDVLQDPQLKVREYWVGMEHDELGEAIVYPGAPVKMSEAPWRMQRRAPRIGEHNDEVYLGELGFSREELTALKTRGII